MTPLSHQSRLHMKSFPARTMLCACDTVVTCTPSFRPEMRMRPNIWFLNVHTKLKSAYRPIHHSSMLRPLYRTPRRALHVHRRTIIAGPDSLAGSSEHLDQTPRIRSGSY